MHFTWTRVGRPSPPDKKLSGIAIISVQAFSEYDLDGNGRIEFGEFLRLFRSRFMDIEVTFPSLYLAQCGGRVTAVRTCTNDQDPIIWVLVPGICPTMGSTCPGLALDTHS